jgi:type II secretory pathway component GspD/PulD (secretin)
MLNKINKVLAIAVIASAFSIPAYSQPINNSSLVGMQQSNKLTISINEISIEEAVKLVCEHFGYIPMLHMPLTDNVSIELVNASFDEAMEKILGNSSTDYMIENNRLHIFKPRESWSRFSDQTSGPAGTPGNNQMAPQPKAEPVITKIIPLGKRTANDIQKLIKELNPQISVVHDAPTNSVIVMGPESIVAASELLCKSIDGMEVKQTATDTTKLVKGLRYITQTFELEHADFDEIEEELSTIIERDTGSSSGSSSSAANLRDKDGNPIETEYFLLDKARRICVVHTSVEKFAVIESYFKAIDKPLPQVLIEASIVAVDDGLEKQLGIKWNGMEGVSGYIGPQNAAAQDNHNSMGMTNKSMGDFFKYGGTWNFSNVQALLKAVETDNKSQILSRPRVITVTGKTSSIHVGDEIPYSSGTSVTDGGTTTSSVSFKEVGIKLDVTPVVNLKDNTIQLNVIPEVSQWVRDVVMGNNIVPQVSTRRAESTIKINNGDTMVIGGLIEAKSVNDVYEVPLLSKIPLVGKAFRSKTTNNTKTNLIILLTAHIVDDNHKSTVASKAVKEMNQVKPLRTSEALSEISEPTVDGPNVYGEAIVWPKPVEETNTVDNTNTNTNNKKVIRSSNMVVGYTEEKSDKDTKVKNTVVDNTEENADTDLRENTETEKYLIKKLKEIRETRNNK